jgi:hypothetical protein
MSTHSFAGGADSILCPSRVRAGWYKPRVLLSVLSNAAPAEFVCWCFWRASCYSSFDERHACAQFELGSKDLGQAESGYFQFFHRFDKQETLRQLAALKADR